MEPEVMVVLTTCPPDKAAALAAALVDERVAACVNIVPAVQSVYRWEGKVQHEAEALLVIKTTPEQFEALKAAILERHPYEVPEIIGLPVVAAHAPYSSWVVKSVS